jgi:hypothetical protein
MHPDAATVLAACRARFPSWNRVSLNGIWIVYCIVLRERCDVAIERHLALEVPAQIRQRVLREITSRRPPNGEDDPMLVWTKLAWYHPEYVDFRYSPTQIQWAWTEVVALRRRFDSAGSAMGLRTGERLRSRAIRKLVRDLKLSTHLLLSLPLGAYNPIEQTLELKNGNSRIAQSLPHRCVNAVDDWIEVRGLRNGLLFCRAPRNSGKHRVELESPEVEEYAVTHSVAPSNSLSVKSVIEVLCKRYGDGVMRFVRDRLLNRGCWPEGLVADLELATVDARGLPLPPLSKYQNKRWRKKLRPILDELLKSD